MCQTYRAEQGTKEKAATGGRELSPHRAREGDKFCWLKGLDIQGRSKRKWVRLGS